MLVGKTFFGLGLQRARALTFTSSLWSLADSGSLNHSAHLLPARAHLYGSSEEHALGTQHLVGLPTRACMEPTACSPSVAEDTYRSHSPCHRLHRDRETAITNSFHTVTELKRGEGREEGGREGGRERRPTHSEHLSSAISTLAVL